MRNAILQELHSEYEQQQHMNQLENDRRQQAAIASCPEIGQVMAARENMIFGTLRGILDGRSAAEDIPARMQVLNTRLEQLLTANGFPKDFLEPVYRCKKCGDTGYVGNPVREQCECLRSAFYTRLYQRMGLTESRAQSFEAFDLSLFSPGKLPGKTYSQQDLMNMIRQQCKTYAEEYPNVRARDLLLMGQSGLGKTFLMHAMAKVLLQRGLNVLVISAYKFLEIARKAYLSGQTEELDSLIDCDVLMIDDMGAEPLMENITIVQWFNLINERQNRRKGTVISTNLMEDELRRRYTERIASRLLGNTDCRLLQFLGEDVRRRIKP